MREDSERNRINQFLSCNVLVVAMKKHVCTVHLHHGQVRFDISCEQAVRRSGGKTHRSAGYKELVFSRREQHAFTPLCLSHKVRNCG